MPSPADLELVLTELAALELFASDVAPSAFVLASGAGIRRAVPQPGHLTVFPARRAPARKRRPQVHVNLIFGFDMLTCVLESPDASPFYKRPLRRIVIELIHKVGSRFYNTNERVEQISQVLRCAATARMEFQ